MAIYSHSLVRKGMMFMPGVGLYQGFALSQYQFAFVINNLTTYIQGVL